VHIDLSKNEKKKIKTIRLNSVFFQDS